METGNRSRNRYLFTHFTGESADGEQVYFSVSRDGLVWEDLNGGKPVLRSDIGEKGVRDPFIIRSRDGERYYILATDLRIASGTSWEDARTKGSRAIIVWESADLIRWEKPRSIEVGIPEAGCVWAPEAIYDSARDAYLVFWASMVRDKHRIYASYTRDFRSFTQPQIYIERSQSVIDTTIVYDQGVFYRFSKDENRKTIQLDAGTDLMGAFTQIRSETLDGLFGVEGPAAFPLPGGEWCLMVDRFAEEKGYMPLRSRDLSTGSFQVLPEKAYSFGKTLKRHGSVLTLTEEEYQRLIRTWGA